MSTLESASGVFSVAFDPRGNTLATKCSDGSILLWDLGIGSIAFDPQGWILAVATFLGRVELRDSHHGTLFRTLGDSGHMYSIAFIPHGWILASGGADRSVRLWDWKTGNLLRTLEGHTDTVDIVAFSNDGRLLASKSNDNTIRLWSCDTWETVAVISELKPKEIGWLPALAFHPTLPWLASAGLGPNNTEPMEIHLWELDYASLFNENASTSKH
ncbi:MAG: hypothetical protein NT069_28760, partial [Planctomycetota bacterium]|nr:hypothetical protein [Planctomycetota bacterium]